MRGSEIITHEQQDRDAGLLRYPTTARPTGKPTLPIRTLSPLSIRQLSGTTLRGMLSRGELSPVSAQAAQQELQARGLARLGRAIAAEGQP